MWDTDIFKKKIFHIDKLYVDVDCSYLQMGIHSLNSSM